MASTDMGEMKLHRSQRGGSIGFVLLIAVVLVGSAIGLLQVGRSNAAIYILILLAILGTVGVFSLFALAAGILRLPDQTTTIPKSGGSWMGPLTESWSRMPPAACFMPTRLIST